MKKLLFGMAFFTGAIVFTSGNLQAQEEEEEGGLPTCYQRMYWCAGEVEVYNCENYQTGHLCSAVYLHCYKCATN